MAALATVQQLADHLGVDVSTLATGTANQALAGASAAVRSECHWQISQALKDQFVLAGSGMSILNLPTGHVTQVWSVSIDGYPLQPIQYSLNQFGQWGFEWAAEGWLKRGPMFFWPQGERRIRVVLDHGYAVIPDDVVAVTAAVASRAMDNPESLRARRVGEVQEQYDGSDLAAYALSKGDRRMLADYRIDPGRF